MTAIPNNISYYTDCLLDTRFNDTLIKLSFLT